MALLSAAQQRLLQNIMGPIGGVLACLMFLSSIDVLLRIVKKRGVGEYSYFPFLVQVCNCALWVAYCCADYKGGAMFWPLLCNGFGFVMASISILIFFIFCTSEQKMGMLWCVVPVAVVLGFDAWVVNDTSGLGVWAIGNACLVINMIMYYGPCAGVGHALKSNSTEYMPLSLGLSTLLCSAPWFTFGFAIENLNIWLPNACGLFFGTVQVAVYAYIARNSEASPHHGLHGKQLFRAGVQAVKAGGRFGGAANHTDPLSPRSHRQRHSTQGNMFDLFRFLHKEDKTLPTELELKVLDDVHYSEKCSELVDGVEKETVVYI